MPVIHSERINASSAKSPSDSTQAKLRGITETELKAWRKAVNDQAILDYDFLDLYEIFDYPFKDHDSVWVHIKEHDQWCLGKVAERNIRIGPTCDRKQSFYYPVVFGENRHIRKYFSPLNGEMKPDNEKIREMLTHGGWLYEDEYTDENSSNDGGSNYTDT